MFVIEITCAAQIELVTAMGHVLSSAPKLCPPESQSAIPLTSAVLPRREGNHTMCQGRPCAAAAMRLGLLDHLVGVGEQRGRDREAERMPKLGPILKAPQECVRSCG
jgi:hypothetical protein